MLELAPDAPPDDIRAAYRRCIGLYHPDKVAMLGAELQALAARKSQDIGAAYRAGMQLHGIEV